MNVYECVCARAVVQVVRGKAKPYTHIGEVTHSAAGVETILGFVVFLLGEVTAGEGSTRRHLKGRVRAQEQHGNPHNLRRAFTREFSPAVLKEQTYTVHFTSSAYSAP